MNRSTSSRQQVSLRPVQLCYVVEDVEAAVSFSERTLGWGPFNRFTAAIDSASYREWTGKKRTEVALGMAGKVQVEFLHVHHGQDAVACYQQEYGKGLQHMGIQCRDRDKALRFLSGLGATINEVSEYPGIRFAFVDVPTGEGMFELLQPGDDWGDSVVSGSPAVVDQVSEGLPVPLPIDRVTIATDDIVSAAAFYSEAFGWHLPAIESDTLEIGGRRLVSRCLREKAGLLEIEIIQPSDDESCPYRQHLLRGRHGMVHAGIKCGVDERERVELAMGKSSCSSGVWLERGESFSLLSGPGGRHSLQIRS